MTSIFGHLIVFVTGVACTFGIIGVRVSESVTTNRIAIAIVLPILVWLLIRQKVAIPKAIFYAGYPALVMFGLSGCVLMFVGGDLWNWLSWLFLALLSWSVAGCVSVMTVEQRKLLLVFIVLACGAIVGYVALLALQDGALLTGGYRLRQWFFVNVEGGQSRFMNGAVVNACFALGLLWSGCSKGVLERAALLGVVMLVVFLAIVGGSRQSLIAMGTFLGFLGIVSSEPGRIIKWMRGFAVKGLIAAAAIMAIASLFIQAGWIDLEWFQKRFLSTVVQGDLTGGDLGRLYALTSGGTASLQNGGFGIGPGNFEAVFGMAPHNGYLGIFAETGVVSGLALCISLGAVFWYIFKRRHLYGSGVALVVIATMLNFALVSANFNDLVREPIYWVLCGLAVGMVVKSKKSLFVVHRFRPAVEG